MRGRFLVTHTTGRLISKRLLTLDLNTFVHVNGIDAIDFFLRDYRLYEPLGYTNVVSSDIRQNHLFRYTHKYSSHSCK